jgi:hypothetical protein
LREFWRILAALRAPSAPGPITDRRCASNGLHFVGHQTECVGSAAHPQEEISTDDRQEEPPLVFTTFPANAPVTFELIAQAFLEGYVLQRYRTLNTIRPRVDYLRTFFGGWLAEAITTDAVRQYQLHRRAQRAEAATINRETQRCIGCCVSPCSAGSWSGYRSFRRGCRRIRRARASSNTTNT